MASPVPDHSTLSYRNYFTFSHYFFCSKRSSSWAKHRKDPLSTAPVKKRKWETKNRGKWKWMKINFRFIIVILHCISQGCKSLTKLRSFLLSLIRVVSDWLFCCVRKMSSNPVLEEAPHWDSHYSHHSDLSYVAVADVRSHVYVFFQPEALTSELRNRKSGQRLHKVSRQLVISLKTHSEVLGMCASPSMLFVLTDKMLYAYCLRSGSS